MIFLSKFEVHVLCFHMFLGVINVDATLCFAYEEIEINPAYFQSRVAF